MSNYIATVIKVGDSYALRVPKQYVDDAHLKLGQKATIRLPLPQPKQDRNRIQTLIKQLQAAGAYAQIIDPAAWQRDFRQDRSRQS